VLFRSARTAPLCSHSLQCSSSTFSHSQAAGKPFEQLLREIIEKVTAIVENVQRGDSVFNIATLHCYFNQ
jgi:hypothetical protein